MSFKRRTFIFRGSRNPSCQIGGLSTLQEIPAENEPLNPAPVAADGSGITYLFFNS
jgi:hypothetical protein